MMQSRHAITALAAATLGAAALAAPSLAQAQMAGLTDESAGFYVGAGAGEAKQDDSCSLPGASISSCDDKDTAWKVYGGWQLNKWLAAELAYVDLGEASFSGSTAGGPFSGETETWGITAHAVGMFPIPIGGLSALSLLGKLGTIWYDRERTSGGGFSGDDDDFAFAWGLGVQYTFNQRVGVRAEWDRYESVGNSSVGEGDIDAWTISLNYKF
jgi:OOP family OmpA-OmpF porin